MYQTLLPITCSYKKILYTYTVYIHLLCGTTDSNLITKNLRYYVCDSDKPFEESPISESKKVPRWAPIKSFPPTQETDTFKRQCIV
jgi:hypothetical protein